MLKLLLIAIFVMLPGVLGNFESHWDHIRPRSSFGNLFNYLFPKTSFAKPIKKPTPSKAVGKLTFQHQHGNRTVK